MKNKQPQAVYDKLENELREQILQGKIDFDKAIAGEIELTEKYRISRKSVRKALDNLAKDGLLMKVQGKGTFAVPLEMRPQTISDKNLNLLLIIPYFFMTSDEYDEHLIEGITSYTAKAGHKLDYSDHELDLEKIKRDFKSGELHGIIWERANCMEVQKVIDATDSGIPVVTLNRQCDNCYSVISDHSAEFDEPISFLHQFGHRRIAFLNRDVDNQSSKKRKNAFFAMIDKYDIKDSADLYVESNLEDLGKKLNVLLQKDPTGLIIGGHSLLGGTLNFCRKNKINVTDDLSIIAINDCFMARSYSTPISVFTEPRQKTGTVAVQLLENVVAGRIHESIIQLKGDLIVRKSCGLPRKNGLKLHLNKN